MTGWTLIVDVALCEGCGNCLLSCKDEHVGNDWPGYTGPQQLHGDHWIKIPKGERGAYPLIDVTYRPTPCQHCAEPACASAVPGAIVRRDDGIVLIDAAVAKGRKELVAACPYGAIAWNDELDVAQKCTLCAHLLDAGWQAPRCVQSCPTSALQFVRADAADSAATGAQALEPLHPELATKPRVLYANLYRTNTCFVAGSVVLKANGREDCLKGATVALHRGAKLIAETTTDAFGDFRFDRLDPGTTGLTVKVRAAGCAERELALDELTASVGLGDIVLDGPRG